MRWAARRLWRQALNSIWGNVSRIEHRSSEPNEPSGYLAPTDSQGRLISWFYPRPKSWSELCAEADERDFSALPSTLLECPELVPFYCLALPHRFNFVIADLLDELACAGPGS